MSQHHQSKSQFHFKTVSNYRFLEGQGIRLNRVILYYYKVILYY